MEPSALALFWAAVIAVAIVAYVVLDGFDLGVGILFGTTRDAALRNEMMDAIFAEMESHSPATGHNTVCIDEYELPGEGSPRVVTRRRPRKP